jgi:hypothetical protein
METATTHGMTELEQRIRSLCWAISRETQTNWVGLARLRELTPDIPRDVLDEQLRALDRPGGFEIVPDDHWNVTTEDVAAALFLDGAECHIMSAREV